MQEMKDTWVRRLGWKIPWGFFSPGLEKEMATYTSILAWRIPWTEEPGRCLLVAQMVKNLPEIQETWVQSLAQEDPLEKLPFTK